MGLYELLDIASLEDALGVTFNDESILRQSLVHRSYLNENLDPGLVSNERLEFLGDAVLGFVVADRLFADFPNASEGELTNLRSVLVRGETLSKVALRLHLEEHLLLGKGEDDSGGRSRPRNLSCALEAVIGAVLVDQGLEGAREFVLRILGDELEWIAQQDVRSDHKSRLQQIVQSESKITPVYRTVDEEGPAHAKTFTVEVVAGDSVLGRGIGRSKRAAEMEAARDALENRDRGA